jgi:demethylmenaquinone methyltransferase/2-methoxy-6-polyprenyl-1,4-benzoquinol methylase
MKNDYTDFGFQQVPVAEKASRVASVFSSVAQKYDIMNDLMSLGIHRFWKKFAIQASLVRSKQVVLDVAGGTGDLAAAFSKRVGADGKVFLTDINPDMLQCGRDRLIDRGIINHCHFVQANAECLPFPDEQFDCVSIAFGLRNVTRKELALKSMWRVLKPGGRLLILEFSKPAFGIFSTIYDQYSFHILPWIGKIVANDRESYQYLVESIRKHPDQETLKNMTLAAGFDQCEFHNLTGGVVALHRAYKY